MNTKEFHEMKDQIKKEILDLDHQILELETYYIEDTKEAGNLIKGFDNYVSVKTSKIQSGVKKQKVQNYERLFSLSSSRSRTSEILEESFTGESLTNRGGNQATLNSQKRNRPRPGGMTKSGGKHLLGRQQNAEEESSESGEAENMEYSMDDSDKNKNLSKKKKITKLNNVRKG